MIDLRLATTTDILEEFRRRKLHFAFIGFQNRNRNNAEQTIYTGCQGENPEQILGLVSLLRDCVSEQIDHESPE